MDKISQNKRSVIMRKVKSSETKLEKNFRLLLWSRGIRYTKDNHTVFGKPDLMIKNKKIVIFIDSCFWHGCKIHLRMPSSNQDYWVNKINRNKIRDVVVSEYYQKAGWNLLRIWEHQLKDEQSIMKEVNKIKVFQN